MSFSISLLINLKKSNISEIETIIKETSENCNVTSIFYDYNFEGINNYIKKNNKIIILEFNEERNLINFLKFIITIRELIIEYIYYDNLIIYSSKKYLQEVSKRLDNKINLFDIIENNKKNNKFIKIYNILNY